MRLTNWHVIIIIIIIIKLNKQESGLQYYKTFNLITTKLNF